MPTPKKTSKANKAKPKKTVRELAAPVQKKKTDKTRIGIRFVEAGSSGIKESNGFIAEAYHAQLLWPIVEPLYSKIIRSMPEIVMVRDFYTSWARNIKPIVELPADASDDDKEYRDYLESDFENMDGGFGVLIETMVNKVPFYGFGWWDAQLSIRDPNWKVPVAGDEWESEEDDGLIGLRRLAWRDPSTFFGWEMPEPSKRLKGMKQQAWPNPVVTLKLDQSLHMTYMDSNNPEGYTPLEAIWRIYTMQYGYQVVHGIGSERGAGYLSIQKTTEGDLSSGDETMIEKTAENLMSGQEGNYGYFPYGLEGSIIDVPFQSASSILDMIKHLSIEALSMYGMQFIALNTMTSTGAQASQVDSTDTGVFKFNAMLDGMAAQYDQQIGRRLFKINRNNFPGVTKRPKIKFSHIDRAIALNDLANFFRTIDGIVPLGDDDYKALRQRSGFLPLNVDLIQAAREARKLDEVMNPKTKAVPGQAVDPNAAKDEQGNPVVGDKVKQMSELGGAGSGFHGHAGRDAENLRGGSKARGDGDSKLNTGRLKSLSEQMVEANAKGEEAGFSYQPYSDTLNPTTGFMSAEYEDQADIMPIGEFSEKRLARFVNERSKYFRDQNLYAGGWVSDGVVYLDISKRFENRSDALASAIDHYQLGVFDLSSKTTFFTSSKFDPGSPNYDKSIADAFKEKRIKYPGP